MEIPPFETERFFAEHEFTAPHLLCASDCETMSVAELLELAGQPWETLGRLRLSYTETAGAPALRKTIAAQYEGVDPEEVLVLAAPEEGIFIAMHALLEPGDEVLVLTPCYDSLRNLAKHVGCHVTPWQLVESESSPERWNLDLDALPRLLARKPRLVIVNFPHNPTGVLPTREEWRHVVELVEQSGALLFSDEMYRGLEYEPDTRLPSGGESGERTLSLSGLSKTYGLPGLRSGWFIARDPALRERLMAWKDYTTICAPGPSELLAEIALGAAEKLAERCRRVVTDNLRIADPFFERWADVLRWNRPRAGSVALVGLRGDRSANEFCDAARAERGVLLLPGTCLGSDDHHFRLGLGRLSFGAGLEPLDAFLESYSARS